MAIEMSRTAIVRDLAYHGVSTSLVSIGDDSIPFFAIV